MNAHLKHIPGLATLTVGGLAGSDLQGPGWESDGALNIERLAARAVDEFLAHLLERGDLARGEGDADLVDFLLCFKTGLVRAGLCAARVWRSAYLNRMVMEV